MNIRKTALGATVGAALLAGGALGGTVLSATAANPTAPAPAATADAGPPAGGPSGKFVPNTNPAHEKAESPAHAAQEAAGQFPTAP
ncbi:MAG: hypothetical protein NVSMB25_24760 [Thermoleophilaceae bacterium]